MPTIFTVTSFLILVIVHEVVIFTEQTTAPITFDIVVIDTLVAHISITTINIPSIVLVMPFLTIFAVVIVIISATVADNYLIAVPIVYPSTLVIIYIITFPTTIPTIGFVRYPVEARITNVPIAIILCSIVNPVC